MFKLIGLVVSVCLTALLISSCSDGTTKSGVDISSNSLAKEQEIAKRELEKINNPSVTLNQACSTSQITVGSTTNGTWTNSDCDSTWTAGGAKFFTFTLDTGGQVTIDLTAPNDPVLILRSGSRTSGSYITRDDDGGTGYNAKIVQTLSSGTYTIEAGHWSYSGLASFSLTVQCNNCDPFIGYVNKYGDLLASYNANSRGKSKSAWGEWHYCNHGRAEGRTYSGLSASSCSSSTTTTTTTSSNAFEGYVNKYGDLLAAFNRVGGSKANWGKNHYCNHGRAEGRTYSGLSAASCSSTTTTTSWPSGNYQYLYDRNAKHLSGHTIRWNSKTIQVSGAHGSWRAAVARWSSATTINLSYVNSPPSRGNGIEIIGRVSSLPSNVCGLASSSWNSSGKLASCKIRFNDSILDVAGCRWTVEHEFGHCLGFKGHATDNGIMRSGSAGGTGQLTSNTRGLINLLYSLAPGTDIRSKVSRLYRMRRDSRKYDPSGSKTYSMDMYVMRDGTTRIVEGN